MCAQTCGGRGAVGRVEGGQQPCRVLGRAGHGFHVTVECDGMCHLMCVFEKRQ